MKYVPKAKGLALPTFRIACPIPPKTGGANCMLAEGTKNGLRQDSALRECASQTARIPAAMLPAPHAQSSMHLYGSIPRRNYLVRREGLHVEPVWAETHQEQTVQRPVDAIQRLRIVDGVVCGYCHQCAHYEVTARIHLCDAGGVMEVDNRDGGL